MVERRFLKDWPTDAAALIDGVAALQARGAVWLRARYLDRSIIVEGWLKRPRQAGLGDRAAFQTGSAACIP
jgi:hypothetical protein